MDVIRHSLDRLLPPRGHIASALLCLLAVSTPSVAADQRPKQRPAPSLNARLDQILRSSAASRGFWGIEVAELPTGKVLFNRDAQHLFHPASNMKLFTTAAALEKLGPSFVFRTTVESDSGPPACGNRAEPLPCRKGRSHILR